MKADSGVQLNGTHVSQWKDSSAAGRTATQSTSTNQPVFVAKAVNGQAALQFDGTHSVLNFSLPLSGSTAVTMIVVSANTQNQNGGSVGSSNGALCWDETASWGSVYVTPFQSSVSYRFGTGQTNNVPTYKRPSSIGTGFSITTAIKNSTTETLFVNGSQVLSQSGKLAKIANVSANAHLGKGYQGYFAGEIAEVLVYNRALSSTERAQIESYLTAKYLKAPVQNTAPKVSAGANQSITLPAAAALKATVTDDGLPSNSLAVKWTTVSGPGTVGFSNAATTSTTASFSETGTYQLKITASDGSLTASSNVTVTVLAESVPTDPIPPSGPGKTYSTQDYVYPSDNGYFNVKNSPYNCFGDGVHDDTECIKAAMDAAMRNKATGGRHATVYFPEGTYLISDTLRWATYGDNDAVVTAKVDPSRGCITGLSVVNAGSGYGAERPIHGESNPGPALYFTGGGGSGASFYTTSSNGSVTGFQTGYDNQGTASCAGRGYTSAPTVTVLNWKAYLRFEGQNKANTIIRLTDKNPRFKNANCNVSPVWDSAAREACRPMILTGDETIARSNGNGEDAYENDVWNLTLDTGNGNPGAIALDWCGSNRAALKNLNIVSGDGQGRAGLSIARGQTGPAYAKNISISGFDYGIYGYTGQHEVGNTFEYIDFSNIHTAGMVNGNMPNWFHEVSADISVPVFVNQGSGSLLVIDGTFTGGASNVTAIQAPATTGHGVMFLRNITTTGYAAALATGSGNTVVPGADISEYAYPAATAEFPSSLKSLNLQNIPNTPEHMDSNFSDWASVASYGANCAPSSNKDATSCIQAAMNSGKPIVYLPFGNYWSSATIHVPSSVRVILGMNSQFSSAVAPGQYPNGDGKHRSNYCVFQFDGSGANPVEFRNMNFTVSTQPAATNVGSICYNGSAPLVVADSLNGVNLTSTTSSSGNIYLEDVAYPGAVWNLKPTQHVYARQYDVESGTGTHVTTNGGIWWMFGFKSEGAGLLWNVSNATFELLGSFGTTAGGPSPNPAFIFNNSTFSLSDVATTSNGWSAAVSETRNGQTLKAPINGMWSGGIGYGLYSGHN